MFPNIYIDIFSSFNSHSHIPFKNPDKKRVLMANAKELLKPKIITVTVEKNRPNSRHGLLPNLSEAIPHNRLYLWVIQA